MQLDEALATSLREACAQEGVGDISDQLTRFIERYLADELNIDDQYKVLDIIYSQMAEAD